MPGNYRELLMTLPEAKGLIYKHGHWAAGTSNVIGHMRMKDRITPDGKKVLFLEELQSDWHQAGRKKGYSQVASREEMVNAQDEVARLQRERNEAALYHQNSVRQNERQPIGKDHPDSIWYSRATSELGRALQRVEDLEKRKIGGVPDAPFKKDWHELLMKRAFQEAADKGYDMVAWTTGEQQAKRYDLSKHISELEWDPNSEWLYARDPDGKRVIEEQVSRDNLDDYIGRETAEKLRQKADEESYSFSSDDYDIESLEDGGYGIRDLNGELMYDSVGEVLDFERRSQAENHIDWLVAQETQNQPSVRLRGLDLKTGGEGMSGFYDRMLPSYANKYGKKFGAGVQQVELPDVGPVHALEITEPMWHSLRERGQPLFGSAEPQAPVKKQMGLFTAEGPSLKQQKKK